MPYGRYRRRSFGYRRGGYRPRFSARRYGGYRGAYKGKQSRVGAVRAHSRLATKARLTSRKLATVAKIAEAGIATLTYRRRGEGFVTNTTNSRINYTAQPGWVRSMMGEMLAELWMFDKDQPANPLILDGNTFGQTNQMDFNFMGGSTRIYLRNNCKVPCKVRLYYVTPKYNLLPGPITDIVTGAATGTQPLTAVQSPLYYPTDGASFNYNWKIEKHWDNVLGPGGHMTQSYALRPFIVDTVQLSDNTDEHQKAYHNGVWLYRIEGVLGHQEDELIIAARSAVTIDANVEVTMKLKYQAGAAYDYIRIVDLLSTDLGAIVIGNRTIAANQERFCGLDDPPLNPAPAPPIAATVSLPELDGVGPHSAIASTSFL